VFNYGPGVRSFDADRFELGRHRRTPSHRFKTASVSAAAHDVVVARNVDVPYVTGGTLGPTMNSAIFDDATANAGPDLDEQQVVGVAPAAPVFAKRHQVDIVVDQGVRAVSMCEPLGNWIAVPAGHDWRADRSPSLKFDWAWDTDAHATYLVDGPVHILEKRIEAFLQPGEHNLGPACDRTVLGGFGEDLPTEISDRQSAVRGSEIGG
jgi:hypothetical protein